MAFVLFAECDVTYEGRANSILPRGNYLIISKSDGSLLVHGADKSIPRNYQSAGGNIEVNNNIITSIRKGEKIIITVYKHYSKIDPINWSKDNIILRKSEKELVNKLVERHEDYIGFKLKTIKLEHKTSVGSIDIFGVDENEHIHIIEVKRKTATLSHCSQLQRYMQVFDNSFGYIASPSISRNAKAYLEANLFKWINIDFD